MIYLIKPHFCIVSRAFVIVRSPIIPARPLLVGHEIAIDDHDPPDRDPFPSLPPSLPFISFLFPFVFVNRTWSPLPVTRGKSFPENRVQKSLIPVHVYGNVTTCNHGTRFSLDFVEFKSNFSVATIAEANGRQGIGIPDFHSRIFLKGQYFF